MTTTHGMMRDEQSEGLRCPLCAAYLDDGYYAHQCSGSGTATVGALILSGLDAEHDIPIGRTWATTTEEEP